MLGSFEEAEDAVQETYGPGAVATPSTGRPRSAWLYRSRRTSASTRSGDRTAVTQGRSLESIGEVPWIQPYPDRLSTRSRHANEPDEVAVRAIPSSWPSSPPSSCFRHASAAVLILRDVLDWSAAETATSSTWPSWRSTARSSGRERRWPRTGPHGRTPPPPTPPTEARWRSSRRRSIAATNERTPAAMAEMLREDVRGRHAAPPFWFNGKETFVPGLKAGLDGPGEWQVPPTANRMPAMASYLRAPGDDPFKGSSSTSSGSRTGWSSRSRRSVGPVPGVRPAARALISGDDGRQTHRPTAPAFGSAATPIAVRAGRCSPNASTYAAFIVSKSAMSRRYTRRARRGPGPIRRRRA